MFLIQSRFMYLSYPQGSSQNKNPFFTYCVHVLYMFCIFFSVYMFLTSKVLFKKEAILFGTSDLTGESHSY